MTAGTYQRVGIFTSDAVVVFAERPAKREKMRPSPLVENPEQYLDVGGNCYTIR
jgi:hypothetical protein